MFRALFILAILQVGFACYSKKSKEKKGDMPILTKSLGSYSENNSVSTNEIGFAAIIGISLAISVLVGLCCCCINSCFSCGVAYSSWAKLSGRMRSLARVMMTSPNNQINLESGISNHKHGVSAARL